MQPLKTKAQLRAELENQMSKFLGKGGSVEAVPNGVSGNIDNRHLFASGSFSNEKIERTPLSELVKEIEERKKQKKEPKRPTRNPKKRVIKDDFGEPIRWVWDE